MNGWLQPEPADWWQIVDDALREDIGPGDLTGGCLPEDAEVEWYIEAQDEGVLSGAGLAFHILSPYPNEPDEFDILLHITDGERIFRGDRIMSGKTGARKALAMERTALNFIMMLSGVATLTARFVAKVDGTGAKIVDTRKTVPGLRSLQKYAVRCGGGANHRMGLYDAAMIKDNHIRACGSITKAVQKLRTYASHMTKIEVECENLEQVEEAVNQKVDVVMLDNMDPFMMREAVKRFGEHVALEASGGISLDTARVIAQTGVHYLSVGALTHSAVALPFHMELS